jgi:hypothetical protein
LSRWTLGAAIGLVSYILFLVFNNGVCPTGGINLWITVIPCKYFWLIDLCIYILFAIFWKSRKEAAKKLQNKKQKKR